MTGSGQNGEDPKDNRRKDARIAAGAEAMESFAGQQQRVRQMFDSPGMKAALESFAGQQQRVREVFDSPGMKAALESFAGQQQRVREVFDSPGMKAALESFAGQQQRVREVFDSPGMKAALESFAGQQQRVREVFDSPGMKAALESFAGQQQRVREALDSPALREALERLAEAYREWDEGERRLLDLLAPRGWVISPSSSLTDLSKLVSLADDQGVDAVEEALVAELTPARCREIVEGLYARPSFAVWRDALDQALVAHEQGQYALSVPVWLIALDGIFLAELGVGQVFSHVHREDGNTLRRRLQSDTGERLLDWLISAIRSVAAHLPAGSVPDPGELRRHAIFHGLDPAYGTEKASVQGVLLLEVLHFQLDVQGAEGVDREGAV